MNKDRLIEQLEKRLCVDICECKDGTCDERCGPSFNNGLTVAIGLIKEAK